MNGAPVTLAIRSPFSTVATWLAGQPGHHRVTDGGQGWTVVDTVDGMAERLVRRFGATVFELDVDDELWRLDPGSEPELVPAYWDEVGPDRLDELWRDVPEVILGDDPRLSSETTSRLVLTRVRAAADLRALALGLAEDVVVWRAGEWILLQGVGRDEQRWSVEPAMADALGTRRAPAAAVVVGVELAEITLSRGRGSRARHVWNLRQVVVGRTAEGDPGPWPGPRPVTAADLLSLSGGSGDAEVIAQGLAEGEAPVDVMGAVVDLLAAVAPDIDSVTLRRLLAGEARLVDLPDHEVVKAPDSFVHFLRSS